MEIAAKVWSWVGAKATETVRFGGAVVPSTEVTARSLRIHRAPVAKVMRAIADGRLIRVQISLRCQNRMILGQIGLKSESCSKLKS
ncbi:hypothetical protein J3P71_01745 [Rhizobium leguminosarum]|uniref:hypothetical protein n=1 Tax=Rhizobium leguminosarum TaxID=384 RepID=UPI0014420030|nr:hypothetical protein [Rhizobium leguminosarum]MBY5836212.1 hypothetical protein [Rhizobium leguminosarum]QSZ08534.1 hypothetical protein J3P71_01745 [Rhizobium leguminosarum]